MTALPGRVDWSPRDVNGWLEQLVAVLPVIHATRIPEGVRVRPYRPYGLGKELAPPAWTRHPRAWWCAIEAYQAGAQRRARVHSP